MEDMFKSFFGEDGSESIDYAKFTDALTKSGMKLADINKGEYVSKAKYDKTLNEYTKYKTDNDVSKYADYETVKAELETLKAEKAENEMLQIIAKKNVDEKFRRFVASETKGLVTKDKNFETVLDEYLKQNPQFVSSPQNDKTKGVFKIGSNGELEKGKSGGEKTTNQKMNNIIRGVVK